MEDSIECPLSTYLCHTGIILCKVSSLYNREKLAVDCDSRRMWGSRLSFERFRTQTWGSGL